MLFSSQLCLTFYFIDKWKKNIGFCQLTMDRPTHLLLEAPYFFSDTSVQEFPFSLLQCQFSLCCPIFLSVYKHAISFQSQNTKDITTKKIMFNPVPLLLLSRFSASQGTTHVYAYVPPLCSLIWHWTVQSHKDPLLIDESSSSWAYQQPLVSLHLSSQNTLLAYRTSLFSPTDWPFPPIFHDALSHFPNSKCWVFQRSILGLFLS